MTRYFNVNNPSNVVTITLDHGNFYQLSDGNMIKKDTFDSKYQPILEGFEHEMIQEKSTQIVNSDFIDPTSFFSATSSINASEIDKLKNVNTNNVPEVSDLNRTQVVNKSIPDNPTQQPNLNEGIITQVDPKNMVIPNNTNTNVSQYKVYENDDDAYEDFIKNSNVPQQAPKPQQQGVTKAQLDEVDSLFEDEKLVYGIEEANKRKTKRMNKLNNIPEPIVEAPKIEVVKEVKSEPIPQFDPIKMMFSTFKRSHEVVFNIQFKDKIANPDFIKMMMENMDGDIVGYYKKIIVENIMKNINIIEDVVETELKKIIGQEEIVEKYNDLSNNPLEVKNEPKKPRAPRTKKPNVE